MAAEPGKRVYHWNAKFDTARAMAAIEAQRPRMLARYAAAITVLCAIEEQVRQVLNERGVPSTSYVWYLDYGQQLYKLSRGRGMAGTSLAQAAAVLAR